MKTSIVDSFTDVPFAGNPAGVCLLESSLGDERMLSIASELGLSETAFVSSRDKDGRNAIRYFSPKMEIPLCGHATLATAKVLLEEGQGPTLRFNTVEGLELTVDAVGDKIAMEFPVYETQPATASTALLSALQIDAVEDVVYNKETNILMLQIADATALAHLDPDFDALLRSHDMINGVLVTAQSSTDDYDFHSRYFWPWSGTNEDPVTGGTHPFLAKYWGQKLGKSKMKSFQASSRTGFMDVEWVGEKLIITGQAVIVLQGELKV